MKKELIEKASALNEEIKELKKINRMLEGKQRATIHFGIIEHYGNNAEIVHIERRHNPVLITILDEIILMLEKEFEEL